MTGHGDRLEVIPAVDIKEGKCVRLTRGRGNEATVYSEDPVSAAVRWAVEGAKLLHVVDLDGAFHGRPVHLDIIAAITRAVRVPVQVGGGLRTMVDLAAVFERGVARAILGTQACRDIRFLETALAAYGERIAVAIDAESGIVRLEGWVHASSLSAPEFARQADEAGVRTLIYTDITRDGVLAGPNAAGVAEICGSVRCEVIASGGVSSARDVAKLVGLSLPNLAGVIVGKALYEGRVTYRELAEAARNPVSGRGKDHPTWT